MRMKLNDSDRVFLNIAAMERIQQHYSSHHDETKADFERLAISPVGVNVVEVRLSTDYPKPPRHDPRG